MAQHRAGKLKQANKKHKVPGGTRASGENRVQGRTSAAKKAHVQHAVNGSKADRINRQKQLKEEKRHSVLAQKRLDTMARTSRIICLLPLQGGESTVRLFFSQLLQLPHTNLSLSAAE
eukprot:gene50811-62145_t